MANYDLTDLAVKMIAPNNHVIVDETDLPSVMVFIPSFKLSDVLDAGDSSTHPAFIVNGEEVPGFYCSKYQNCIHSGVAYSLPAQDPANTINFDNSRARCEAKGNGWHLMTAAEWAAIALWCKANGFQPLGNNNYGKDASENNYRAIPSCPRDGSNRIQRIATGTGPLTWYHDQTLGGIADLNGNVNEWLGGIRFVWGELQILANNNAADPDNPQNATSEEWKAIDASTGDLVTPECKTTDVSVKSSGSTLKMDWVSNAWKWVTGIQNAQSSYKNCAFESITADSGISAAALLKLRALALMPDSNFTAGDYKSDQFYLDHNKSERGVARGGGWSDGARAGLFLLSGIDARSGADDSLGFRSAYIPEIG